MDLDVAGDWQNPFDPDQVEITAHFTAPSGQVLRVPAFYYQGYRCSPLPAAEKRRRVNLLKLYINERDWGPHGKVDFFIDDVRLLKSATGEEVLLDDMEDDAPRWWPPEQAESRLTFRRSGVTSRAKSSGRSLEWDSTGV